MTVLPAVRAWLRKNCPLIDESDRFNASYLGAKPHEYALALAGETHTQDICGCDRATVQLLFMARMPYGEALAENLSAAAFFQQLSGWLAAAERAHRYPSDIDGYTVCRLSASNAGVVLTAGAGAACYQLQLTLIMEENEDA